MLKKWDLTGDTHKYFTYLWNDKFLEYKNPGIPLILITLRGVKTNSGLIINADLYKHKRKDIYYIPKVIFGYGDGTI